MDFDSQNSLAGEFWEVRSILLNIANAEKDCLRNYCGLELCLEVTVSFSQDHTNSDIFRLCARKVHNCQSVPIDSHNPKSSLAAQLNSSPNVIEPHLTYEHLA